MKFGRWFAAGALAAGLLVASPSVAQDDLMSLFGGGDAPKGEELDELIEAAQEHPLGSEQNPVRAEMPTGQRAYLARLRCSDGQSPQFGRIGNFGFGVYGRIIDGYRVICEGSEPAESTVFMDMYHPGHIENVAVPGFTIEGGVVSEPAQPSEHEETPAKESPTKEKPQTSG